MVLPHQLRATFGNQENFRSLQLNKPMERLAMRRLARAELLQDQCGSKNPRKPVELILKRSMLLSHDHISVTKGTIES